MKNSKKTITLCASASFYRKVIELESELKKLGFKVKIPKTAGKMKKSGNFDVSVYKTWYNNAKDYSKKTSLIKGHYKKPIFVYDAVFEGSNILEEIYGLKPIFINKDLSLIAKKLH